MKKLKGLPVSVYRSADGMEATLGGITSNHTRLILVGEGVPEIFEGMENEFDVLVLERRILFGKKAFYARPFDKPDNVVGPMFGGNFVYTSDSRFSEISGGGPLPVHDRFETQEMYDALSK